VNQPALQIIRDKDYIIISGKASKKHHSRFFKNAAGDLGKMLQVVGVDKVISVDLQRPGQGHEACLFNTLLPAETISTTDAFVSYFTDEVSLHDKV
jgi:ribose-phosphate pyrophosphokinase